MGYLYPVVKLLGFQCLADEHLLERDISGLEVYI